MIHGHTYIKQVIVKKCNAHLPDKYNKPTKAYFLKIF